MADSTTPAFDPGFASDTTASPLGRPIDFDVRGLGRRLPRTEAPEGWTKKVDRRREGKVWNGFFHLWTIDADGRRVRQKKEKTLGLASMPKHEAQEKLADYITEYTGRLTKQGDSISTFGELWKAFCAVKSGQWSKRTKENLQCLFGKHVNKWRRMAIASPLSARFVPTSSLASITRRMKTSFRRAPRGNSRCPTSRRNPRSAS